ncbi:MAG: glycosyltransferase [Vampirovibrionales bacterium]
MSQPQTPSNEQPTPPHTVTVVCMKWGQKFGPHYPNRLFAMVQRHLQRPHRFVCFTDDATGLHPSIEVHALPEMTLDNGLPERGWRKLSLFSPNTANLQGQVLFLDLDVVITGGLDAFFDHPGEFIIAKDWDFGDDSVIGNSSVFRYEAGKHHEVLTHFLAHGEAVRQTFRNEQAYLSHKVHESGCLSYWPSEWCVSFKRNCLRPFPLNFFMLPKEPKQAKVLVFHGRPTPEQALQGYMGKLGLRYVKPTTWLQHHWVNTPEESSFAKRPKHI